MNKDKILLICDKHIELTDDIDLYSMDSLSGIIYDGIVIEPKYNIIYRIGKNILLINKNNGNIAIIDKNKTVKRLTQINILNHISNIVGLKNIKVQNIYGYENMILSIYYVIGLELIGNTEYYKRGTLKRLKIESLYGDDSGNKYRISYIKSDKTIEINIYNKKHKETTSLIDITQGRWIINPLEMVKDYINGIWYTQYKSVILGYGFYLTDRYKKTRSVHYDRSEYYKDIDRENEEYKIGTLTGKNSKALVLIDNLRKDINILAVVGSRAIINMKSSGLILIKVNNAIVNCDTPLLNKENYNKIYNIYTIQYRNKGDCYILLDPITNTKFNGILILENIHNSRIERINIFDLDGNKYRGYFNYNIFKLDIIKGNNINERYTK